MLFNDARYRLFGEQVAAHRVFLVALFALYAGLLARVATALGAPAPAAVGAGLLLLCSRYSAYHYVWLTDGNHLPQGLLFALAALALLAGLRRRSWPRLAASIAALAAATLVREDSLALVPVLVLFGFVAAPRERRALLGFAAALLAAALALFVYRLRAVPAAAPPGLDVRSFAVAVVRTLVLPGPESFAGLSRAVVWVWIAGESKAPTHQPAVVGIGNRHWIQQTGHWKANIMDAVENQLDVAHTPFSHPGIYPGHGTEDRGRRSLRGGRLRRREHGKDLRPELPPRQRAGHPLERADDLRFLRGPGHDPPREESGGRAAARGARRGVGGGSRSPRLTDCRGPRPRPLSPDPPRHAVLPPAPRKRLLVGPGLRLGSANNKLYAFELPR